MQSKIFIRDYIQAIIGGNEPWRPCGNLKIDNVVGGNVKQHHSQSPETVTMGGNQHRVTDGEPRSYHLFPARPDPVNGHFQRFGKREFIVG